VNLTSVVETAGLWSYAAVFALTAGETSAFIGLFLPGETLILFAAALSARGDLNPVLLAITVVTGGIVGDSVGYAVGRWYERWPRPGWTRRRSRRQPSAGDGRRGSRVGNARNFLRRHGGSAVFIGRFIGFVRTFLPFVAGASGMPYRRFLPYSAAACVVWGVANVVAGYFLGSAAERLLRTVGLAGAATAVGAVVVTFLAVSIRRRSAARTPTDGTHS
jgi:membrane protein DedA with SNARE-associated domain